MIAVHSLPSFLKIPLLTSSAYFFLSTSVFSQHTRSHFLKKKLFWYYEASRNLMPVIPPSINDPSTQYRWIPLYCLSLFVSAIFLYPAPVILPFSLLPYWSIENCTILSELSTLFKLILCNTALHFFIFKQRCVHRNSTWSLQLNVSTHV